MGSTNARSAAIAALTSFKSVAPRVNFQTTPIKDLFASNVFGEEAQRERLPKVVFKKLQQILLFEFELNLFSPNCFPELTCL